jgi:pilus assembly protein CpaE
MGELLLIVDDDVDTLRLVGIMLERQGYSILAANEGKRALELAREKCPDLILMDVTMPVMNGYELTRQLRSDPATSEIPVIMLTAKGDLDDKVSGFEAGVDDYLTKPTQPRELFAHIRAVLTRSSKRFSKITDDMHSEGGKVVGILSAKGGLGNSTLTLSLGITLKQRTNKEVIVAEYRPGQGSLGLTLGFDHQYDNLHKLLDISPSEISQRHIQDYLAPYTFHVSPNSFSLIEPVEQSIKLLLSSYKPSNARYLTQVETFKVITRLLTKSADYILLDLGPSIPPITDKVLEQCDYLILVTEPLLFSIIQTQELLTELKDYGFEQDRLKVVLINRFMIHPQATNPRKNPSKASKNTPNIFTSANGLKPISTTEIQEHLSCEVIRFEDEDIAEQFHHLANILAERIIQLKPHG